MKMQNPASGSDDARAPWAGPHALQQYQMTFLDKLGLRITVRDFAGADDAAAMAHAHTLCSGHTIMVTQADRTVGKVMKGAVLAPMAPCA